VSELRRAAHGDLQWAPAVMLCRGVTEGPWIIDTRVNLLPDEVWRKFLRQNAMRAFRLEG